MILFNNMMLINNYKKQKLTFYGFIEVLLYYGEHCITFKSKLKCKNCDFSLIKENTDFSNRGKEGIRKN